MMSGFQVQDKVELLYTWIWSNSMTANTRNQQEKMRRSNWDGIIKALLIYKLQGGCFSIVVFPSLEQACPPLDLSFWVDSRRNWNPWVTFHLENEKLTRKGFSQLLFASFNCKTSIQTSQCKTCLPNNLHYFRKPRFYFKHDRFYMYKVFTAASFWVWSFKNMKYMSS